MDKPTLKVRNLKKYFPVQKGFIERLLAREVEHVKAVDDVSFDVNKGEIFSLVGESGCGKTTTGKLIIRLIDPTDGRIIFDGKNITFLNGEELRKFRKRIQMIPQDPETSFNPRMRVGDAVGHPLEIHGMVEGEEKRELVLEMMEKVGLEPPERIYDAYPHELSGGQRQRTAVARSMILNPEFVVADEPISKVDASLRAEILELMLKLKKDLGLTYLFITHDLAVAKYISDRISVMYLGKIVEQGHTSDIFNNPMHPYTEGLLSAIPIPDPCAKRGGSSLKGEVPDATNPPLGCRFHPRCPHATSKCKSKIPKLKEIGKDHLVACWNFR